jgi:glycosyltransferase involved in cell wall biosynthesis
LTALGEIDMQSTRRITGGQRLSGLFKVSSPMKPLVSVLTVVLNDRSGLEKTIESVLAQTYENIEYIVIDGNSTDGSVDMIRTCEERIDYWVSEPDEGISDAFNKGIRLATGDIVGIINAGDWYEPNAVRNVVNMFLTADADIVHGKMQMWEMGIKSELVSANAEMLIWEMTLNHPATFIRRECYEKIGYYNTDFHYAMDYEWALRAKTRDLKMIFVESCLANMNRGGVSNRFWRKGLREVLKAKQVNNPGVANYLYFIWQNIKGTVSIALDHCGMRWLIRYYHGHLSNVKKEWRGR